VGINVTESITYTLNNTLSKNMRFLIHVMVVCIRVVEVSDLNLGEEGGVPEEDKLLRL
jgi:hypothetical protein